MKNVLSIVPAVLVVAALAACSGGKSAPLPVTAQTPVTTSSIMQTATLTLKIPARTSTQSRAPKYVSQASNGISIVAYNAATITGSIATPPPVPTAVADISPSSSLCTSNGDGSRSCSIQVSAPVGVDNFIITTYDLAPSGSPAVVQGNVLSTQTLQFTIVGGQTNTVLGVVLNGVPKTIVLSPVGFLLPANQNSTFTFNVNARDAAGNFIIGAGYYDSPIALSIANDPNSALSLSTTQITSPATTTVTATYSAAAGLPGVATVTGAASGATSGSLTIQVSPTATTIITVNVPYAITEYTTPYTIQSGQNAHPYTIVDGPDGNIWYSQETGGLIGRVTPATGAITEFSTPTVSTILDLHPGPDGNMWFTEGSANAIGRYSFATNTIVEFPVPTANSTPTLLASGPDGNLWFTEQTGGKIGRIIPSTGQITEYALPSPSSNPLGICVGPDGNIWVAENATQRVAQFSFTTGQITEYPTAYAEPIYITAMPDGELWVVSYGAGPNANGSVSRINPTTGAEQVLFVAVNPTTPSVLGPGGASVWVGYGDTAAVSINVTTHATTTFPGIAASSFAAGPDGNMWMVSSLQNRVSRYNVAAGTFTHFPVLTGSANPFAIVAGPDNASLWFTEYGAGKIGRAQP